MPLVLPVGALLAEGGEGFVRHGPERLQLVWTREVVVRVTPCDPSEARSSGADARAMALWQELLRLQADPEAMDRLLVPSTSAFRHRVLRAVMDLAVGTVVSYGSLAQRMGIPEACRAVAAAVASNTLAVVVPCHRVIRADGTVGGYRWGVAAKLRLLEAEGIILGSP
ncbi:MAG: methylated-DNA--[protein]-cysteine S-methyltransferase [Candidatus Sericytochromatia bacterium]|nr:methylated-DNA--[protein]-cysteine S-methyltransferase [Candidatus Sericytochromatia bacterium]